MEQIRAFIAIELPADVKAGLKDIQSKLKQTGGNAVKWVEPANLHLTLKFLGNIALTQIEPIASTLRSSTRTTGLFHLGIDRPGCFPDSTRMRVVWVGLNGDVDTLFNLQKNLDSRLAELGFPPENKPFSPHLTLGRVRESATLSDKQNIGKALSSIKIDRNPTFAVHAVNLMQSRLSPAGPLYTCLNTVELTGPGVGK